MRAEQILRIAEWATESDDRKIRIRRVAIILKRVRDFDLYALHEEFIENRQDHPGESEVMS